MFLIRFLYHKFITTYIFISINQLFNSPVSEHSIQTTKHKQNIHIYDVFEMYIDVGNEKRIMLLHKNFYLFISHTK